VPIFGLLVRWADRGWRWVVVGAVGLVVWSGPMRFTPTNGLRELHDSLPVQLVANCYGLLGLGFLAWLLLTPAPPDRSRSQPAPAVSITWGGLAGPRGRGLPRGQRSPTLATDPDRGLGLRRRRSRTQT
jgi:hypothetical protein